MAGLQSFFLSLDVQMMNLIITAGIVIFVFSYMVGKLIFIDPFLNARLEKVWSEYNVSTSLDIQDRLNNRFLDQREKKKRQKIDWKKKIIEMALKNPIWGDDNLKLSFDQAGWNFHENQIVFLGSKTGCFFLGMWIGYMVILTRPAFAGAAFGVKWIILSLTAFSGWLAPDLYLKGVIKKRVELIEKQFPDALDLIIICLQAGLGLNRAIDRVAKEIIIFGEEIAHELTIAGVELEIMLDRRQALQNLHLRVPSSIIRSFSTTILQSIQQGTPTLQALDVLSKEIRDTRMQKAETKAAKLPSLLVIPMVLFVMPNLFIVLLGPAIARLLNVT